MKLKKNHSLVVAILFSIVSYGQMDSYNYKQEIENVSDLWHSITLPSTVFQHLKNDVKDIRVYGITEKDTIEAPYILKQKKEEIFTTKINFKKINESHNSEGYYYTFEVDSEEEINHIYLKFEEDNFEWNINLEGSLNNNDWFTILDDYRILSIKNNQTNYRFSDLTFPPSKYRYYRIFVTSTWKPKLTTASLHMYSTKKAEYYDYPSFEITSKTDRKEKNSVFEITLEQPVSVSYFKINVLDTINYYRPFNIQYVTDSIKTDKGWKYNYRTLKTGTLNSIEKNEFTFNSTILQKLKITVNNFDNQPLHFSTFEVKGYTHELIARFNELASYFLTYGNINASNPNYDINQFLKKIPLTLKPLQLKGIQSIEKEQAEIKEALFTNKIWLWILMAIICIVLGFFSLKMIKKV